MHTTWFEQKPSCCRCRRPRHRPSDLQAKRLLASEAVLFAPNLFQPRYRARRQTLRLGILRERTKGRQPAFRDTTQNKRITSPPSPLRADRIRGIESRSRSGTVPGIEFLESVSVQPRWCWRLTETGTSIARAQSHDRVNIAEADATHPPRGTRPATTGFRPGSGTECAARCARVGTAQAWRISYGALKSMHSTVCFSA